MRLVYAVDSNDNEIQMTRAWENEYKTFDWVYNVNNTGSALEITKYDLHGYEKFLKDEAGAGTPREYTFGYDETFVNHGGEIWVNGVSGQPAEIAVHGAGKTLSDSTATYDDDGNVTTRGSNLALFVGENQTASVDNLTVKGFRGGIVNLGTITDLNNITIKNEKYEE